MPVSSSYAQHVGLRFRHLRMERHLSQKAAALAADWTQNDLCKFELGQWRLVDPLKVLRLAQALEGSLDRLLGPLEDRP